MNSKWHRFFFLLFCAGALSACIDPFAPKLEKFESLLVVDALITDANASNHVILTRTVDTIGEDPERVTGAIVTIKDDIGNIEILTERNRGEYYTDSLLFRGEAGRTYTLYITTDEGNEYESRPCTMYEAPDIDSIYYAKDRVISDKTGEPDDGIRFYFDSRGESAGSYYRWAFEEWWKFKVPEPKLYDFRGIANITPVAVVKQTCWGHTQSNGIMIRSADQGNTGIVKKPVLFVSSKESSRLTIQYCLVLKLFSVSKEEFEFWNLMTQLNETGGDIFDKQPFHIFSNIRSLTNPGEKVAGYFQVSCVKQKSINVTVNEILDLGLPLYRYDCDMVIIGESDYPPPLVPGAEVTFYDIYKSFAFKNYVFTRPVYSEQGALSKLVFVRPFCADCTLNGSLAAPDFWVDIE